LAITFADQKLESLGSVADRGDVAAQCLEERTQIGLAPRRAPLGKCQFHVIGDERKEIALCIQGVQEGAGQFDGFIAIGTIAERGCSATREILERIGDKWTLYVVGALRNGPRRFNELRREVSGISQRMLTLTLRGLERDGLVTRTVFPSIPPRVDYELTELGRTLLGPVTVLMNWANSSQRAIETAREQFDAERREVLASGCSAGDR